MQLSPGAKRLFDLLNWCKSSWTHVAPSQKWLASKLKLSLRTLQRLVATLKEVGLLKVVPRYKRTALYKLMESCGQLSFFFVDGGPVGGAELERKVESIPKPASLLPHKIQQVLSRAAWRIRRAANPAAYRQAIISCELRLLKLKHPSVSSSRIKRLAQIEYVPNRKADERAVDRFFGWAMSS